VGNQLAWQRRADCARWVTPLKEVGHGTGGALTGMQFFGELVSTVRGFLPTGKVLAKLHRHPLNLLGKEMKPRRRRGASSGKAS